MAVKCIVHNQECKKLTDDLAIKFLEEAKDMIAAEASKLSPVDSGKLKRSFQDDSEVNKAKKKAFVGSTLEYSIYQEKGTGEFATTGGRKGGWAYCDDSGKWHFTKGSKPHRMLERAFQNKNSAVKRLANSTYSKGFR